MGDCSPEMSHLEVEDNHPSFQLGMESSTERLHELQFSLVHHASGCGSALDNPIVVEDVEPANEQEIIAAEISALSLEHQPQVRMDSAEDMEMVGPPGLLDDEEEDLGALMAIQRVDSRDVVFDNRQKKAKILGHYVMGDVLGEGSYAKVKEAIDQDTLCRRAVKIMKRKKLRRIPHGEENVEREIKLLATLEHQNIMSLIEVFYNEEKGKIYLVLEYCCAVLKDMIEGSENKRFPIWQTHFYFSQLVEGLEYLHCHRVIHKDIKPGNLLLSTAGNLKITDFGTCEVLDPFAPDDTCYTSQGTPAFQPPEIANGAKSFPGYKVDIWSSGVTLFHFVTGDYPFNGDTIFRLFEDIGKCEYQIPSSLVDPVLESLIRGMLTLDPEERFSLVDVKKHDWMRKKHPCNCNPVTINARDDDPALSTTVIPYLADLHYGSQLIHEGEEDDDDEALQFLTEHQMKEIEKKKVEEEGEEGEENGNAGNGVKNGVSKRAAAGRGKKEKTTKCIKVRKMSGCQVV